MKRPLLALAALAACLSLATCKDAAVDGARLVNKTAGVVRGALKFADGADWAGIGDKAIRAGLVLIQNARTGEVFQGLVDAAGGFEIAVPGISGLAALGAEGTTFMLSLVSEYGKPLGTLTNRIAAAAGSAYTAGLDLLGGADLDISVPTALGGAIRAMAGAVDWNPSTVVRADSDGVPVGQGTFGKGGNEGVATSANAADPDGDGLPSVIDADDDGDGIADEFDTDNLVNATGNARVNVALGYLLDLENEQVLDFFPKSELAGLPIGSPPAYYATKTDEERNLIGLTRDQRVDVWVQPADGVRVLSARLVPEAAPSYAEELYTGPQNLFNRWKDTPGAAYQLTERASQQGNLGLLERDLKAPIFFKSASLSVSTDPHSGGYYMDITAGSPRFSVGDTFTFEIEEEGGAKYLVSKMINFAFKKPFLFKRYGPASGTLASFTPSYDGINNIWKVDPAQDLEIVFSSPLDERGLPLTSGATFEIVMNYNDSSGQLQQLDWPGFLAANGISATPVTRGRSWDGRRWKGAQSELGIDPSAADGEFTVVIPKELFLRSVRTEANDGSHAVSGWTIGAAFIVGELGGWDVSTIQNRVTVEPLP